MLPNQQSQIESVISFLKLIDIDGETLQYIIEELNMQEQIIKQLIRTYPTLSRQELIDYKNEFATSDDLEREMMLDNAFFYVADDHANELDNLIK